jgi:hypothetical protein
MTDKKLNQSLAATTNLAKSPFKADYTKSQQVEISLNPFSTKTQKNPAKKPTTRTGHLNN